LARARDVFAKRGYHASKIEDIVAAAKVARGTFYLYFEDNAACSRSWSTASSPACTSPSAHRSARPSRSVAARIREKHRARPHAFLQDRAMTKILLTDAPGLDADFDRKLQAVYEEVLSLLAESFAEGQTLGIVATGDTRVFALPDRGRVEGAALPGGDARLRSGQRRTPDIGGLCFSQPGCLRVGGESQPLNERARRRS